MLLSTTPVPVEKIPPPKPNSPSLPVTVESITTSVPPLSIPAPSFPAMLLEIVLPTTVVSEPAFNMPRSELFDTLESMTDTEPLLKMPGSPLEMLRPEMVAVTPESTVKSATDPPPLTSRFADPGPEIVRSCEISIVDEIAIVEQGGDNANVMVSPAVAFATS